MYEDAGIRLVHTYVITQHYGIHERIKTHSVKLTILHISEAVGEYTYIISVCTQMLYKLHCPWHHTLLPGKNRQIQYIHMPGFGSKLLFTDKSALPYRIKKPVKAQMPLSDLSTVITVPKSMIVTHVAFDPLVT